MVQKTRNVKKDKGILKGEYYETSTVHSKMLPTLTSSRSLSAQSSLLILDPPKKQVRIAEAGLPIEEIKIID